MVDDHARLAKKWLTEKRKISAEKKSRISPLAQIIEEEITGLLGEVDAEAVLQTPKKAPVKPAPGSVLQVAKKFKDPEALKLANAIQKVMDSDRGRDPKNWTKHIPVFLRKHAKKGILNATEIQILEYSLTSAALKGMRKEFRDGIVRVIDQYIGGWEKEPNKSKKVFKAKGPGMTSAKAPMTIDPNNKKIPKKKPKMVSGNLGQMITVPDGALVAPPFYRMKDLKRAMHKDDPRWVESGYAWKPQPGEEKGPPGWQGHVVVRNLKEAPQSGVLHFHHPKWQEWKRWGGKHTATHAIGRFGNIQKRGSLQRGASDGPMSKAEEKPTAQSVPSQTKTGPAIKTKAAAAEPPQVKKDVTDINPVKLVNTVSTWIDNNVSEFIKDSGEFLKSLLSRFNMTPEQEQEIKKTVIAKSKEAQPQGEQAWVGKSMREVIKLTKSELKRLGFTGKKMRINHARRYPNKTGRAWFWGGLMSLRRNHPLKKKYSAWYKDRRQKKRDERRARRAARKARRRS